MLGVDRKNPTLFPYLDAAKVALRIKTAILALYENHGVVNHFMLLSDV
jgi:hypothetical protein